MSDTAPVASQGFPPANPDGSPALVGPDEFTRRTRINRIEQNNTTVLSGNYADIQRIGADAAVESTSGNLAKSIGSPPGIDPKDDKVKTPAQAEADRGEFTRETERTGKLKAPPAAEPPDNDAPDSVDPGSVSPTIQAKGSVAGTSAGVSADTTGTSTTTTPRRP